MVTKKHYLPIPRLLRGKYKNMLTLKKSISVPLSRENFSKYFNTAVKRQMGLFEYDLMESQK